MRPAGARWTDLPLDRPLPQICLKCGATTDLVERSHVFVFIPKQRARNAMIYGALFGAMGGAIAGAANAKHQRQATLSLPLCRACDFRWSEGKRYTLWSRLFLFAVLGGSLLIGVKSLGGGLVLTLMGAAFVAMFLATRFAKNAALQVEHLDEGAVVVTGVAEPAREALAKPPAPRKPKKKRKRGPLQATEPPQDP